MENTSHKKIIVLVVGLIVIIALVVLLTPNKAPQEYSASLDVEETEMNALQDLLPEALPMDEDAEILESYTAADPNNNSRFGVLSYETSKDIDTVYEEYTEYLTSIQDEGATISREITPPSSGFQVAVVSSVVNRGVFQATLSETGISTRVDIGYTYVKAVPDDGDEE